MLNSPLDPYLNTPIKLFIADKVLLKQTQAALKQLQFEQVSSIPVKSNYFMAMRQLYGEIAHFEGIVLVNHPPQKKKDSKGLNYEDMTFADFYQGVASFNQSTRKNVPELLHKCLPIFVSAQDHDIRMHVVEDLFSFGIVAVFMLKVQDFHMSRQDQMEERINELQDYLLEYFLQRNAKLAEFREYKSAEDLKERRKKAKDLMAEVEEHKKAKEFDKAIALCRRAIEVLPTNPSAYLESGRLLVKKKKYPPALQMFRDAERVAEQLPAPNREIANLRVAQIKDYVQNRKEMGLAIDKQIVENYLADVAENFKKSLTKAEQIQAVHQDKIKTRRKDAIAQIAENILTLELEDILGIQNPLVMEMGKLAQKTLVQNLKGEGQIDPKYFIQFGLMAFQQGELEKAEKYLVKAARQKECFEEACRKLNYIGTQLRQRDQTEQAIKIYEDLLKLKPPFKGVVLFNLAVALQTKALKLSSESNGAKKQLEQTSIAYAVESIYIDPSLPKNENFYSNTVIKPLLLKTVKMFSAVMSLPRPHKTPKEMACQRAAEELEVLLKQKKDTQALNYLFSLAQKQTDFFLEFEKHTTPLVLNFARRLDPLLKEHPKPKLRTFGKIVQILVSKGVQAQQDAAFAVNPALHKVMEALFQTEQAKAANELVTALFAHPQLLKTPGFQTDKTLNNLCLEINSKLKSIDFNKFN